MYICVYIYMYVHIWNHMKPHSSFLVRKAISMTSTRAKEALVPDLVGTVTPPFGVLKNHESSTFLDLILTKT